MQARRSSEPQRFSYGGERGDREGLMHSYDVEEGRDAFGLEELAEDSDEDDDKKINGNGNGLYGNGKANANVGVKRSFSEHGGSRKASPLPR